MTKRTKPAREIRATLDLVTPVTGADGRPTRRFVAGESMWHPEAMPIPIGPAAEESPLLLSARPGPAPKPQTMMVPGYAITEVDGRTGQGVHHWVPLHQVASICTPVEVVPVQQPDGSVGGELVKATEAEARRFRERASEAARGGETLQ